ncbi:hypothetical protein HDU96_001648 [Phlyctochytrium bullatum]|nr:hypothetical protein HDU96_001648 [Phlyctochytrium bullatum]
MPSLLSLPTECLIHILTHLPTIHTLFRLLRLDRRTRRRFSPLILHSSSLALAVLRNHTNHPARCPLSHARAADSLPWHRLPIPYVHAFIVLTNASCLRRMAHGRPAPAVPVDATEPSPVSPVSVALRQALRERKLCFRLAFPCVLDWAAETDDVALLEDLVAFRKEEVEKRRRAGGDEEAGDGGGMETVLWEWSLAGTLGMMRAKESPWSP